MKIPSPTTIPSLCLVVVLVASSQHGVKAFTTCSQKVLHKNSFTANFLDSESTRLPSSSSMHTSLSASREKAQHSAGGNVPLNGDKDHGDDNNDETSKRKKIKKKMLRLANRILDAPVARPIISKVYPQAIAEIITDATAGAIEEVSRIGQIRQSLAYTTLMEHEANLEGETAVALDTIALAKTQAADAFALAESAIEETEEALKKSKLALAQCRDDVAKSIAIAERSAMQANVSSQKATALAASAAISASSSSLSASTASEKQMVDHGAAATSTTVVTESEEHVPQVVETPQDGASTGLLDETTKQVHVVVEDEDEDSYDIDSLAYDDVDYHLSEMAPPFIGEDQCLVPGEAVVRVEKAKENSRRIFAGIDILASVDDVWDVLTDYENLQQVVPNLVVNDVVELYDGDKEEGDKFVINPDIKSEDQCSTLSKTMKGAKLKQIGGAKVVGVNFSAQVTLEVREWPQGMPDFFHFDEDVYEGRSRAERAKLERQRKLERYHFPRPFAISKLPTKDISMQSVENDDGEFRLYQGVWRMTPLPGCAPPGGAAMRLTYAVEISPRPYLPVAFVEGRISQDLCNNLRAIRDHVTKAE